MIDLLICDDSAEARAGLRTMLADQDHFRIVGEAANGKEAVARVRELAPDVVLMDVQVPIVDVVDATRRIAHLAPTARVVALAGAEGTDSTDELLAAGAAACIAKDAPLRELARAIAGEGDYGERRGPLAYAEARRDAVTGVPNRRAFDECLADSLEDAATSRRELSVTVLDLDDFKRVNDTCGHAQGDSVLAQVARAALRVLRPGEDLFRVGGDEFGLVVPAGTSVAVGIAERIQAAVREQARTSPLPTISAGVATFPTDARSAGDLIYVADAALRVSKRNGKQRISVAGAPAVTRRSGSRDGAAVASRRRVSAAGVSRGARVLFVDDDPATLKLLRATFELIDIQVSQASSAAEALSAVAASPPDVVVLDIALPDVDGLTLCRRLKDDLATSWIGVILLTGAGAEAEPPARAAGADAFLLKPFSPLELLAVVERLAGGLYEGPFRAGTEGGDEQLLRYAGDLRRLLQIERGRQELVQRTYRQTVAALAGALETKDIGTGSHSQRVRRYAVELARTLDPSLLENASVEYGFLLHDVGKIGIPDHVLQKRGPLDGAEQEVMRTHTVLGEQLLGDVDLLHGDGLKVVRGHHERWDGTGYPDGLAGTDIPLAARVFAVADALDAITSDRPYRAARSWDEATSEILVERGRQFDPDVVDVFRQRERELHAIRRELTPA